MPENLHPDCFKARSIRRIDRLYALADNPKTPRFKSEIYLEEIKFINKQLELSQCTK